MMQRLSIVIAGITGYTLELPDRAANAELPHIGDVLGVPADLSERGINGALVIAVRRNSPRPDHHGEVDAIPLGEGA